MENLARDNSQKQFIEIHNTYSDQLFRYIFLRVKDRDDALDLTQYVFTRFYEYSKKTDVEYPKAFLFRQAHNAIANHWRAKKHNLSLEKMAEEGFDIASSEHVRLGVSIDVAQAIAIMNELPDIYQDVLTLHYIEELSIDEISTMKEEHKNTISVRLHRAKKMLEKKLKEKHYE